MNPKDDQFALYRGLQTDVPVRDIKQAGAESNVTGGVGIHWTPNLGVAKVFAKPEKKSKEWAPDWEKRNREKRQKGTILHGTVSKSNTMTPYTDDWEPFAYVHGIAGPDDWEREVTVKPGASVNLTGVTHIRPRGPRGGLKSRNIKFNPSRKAKA